MDKELLQHLTVLAKAVDLICDTNIIGLPNFAEKEFRDERAGIVQNVKKAREFLEKAMS